jgi:hypothetical protein
MSRINQQDQTFFHSSSILLNEQQIAREEYKCSYDLFITFKNYEMNLQDLEEILNVWIANDDFTRQNSKGLSGSSEKSNHLPVLNCLAKRIYIDAAKSTAKSYISITAVS